MLRKYTTASISVLASMILLMGCGQLTEGPVAPAQTQVIRTEASETTRPENQASGRDLPGTEPVQGTGLGSSNPTAQTADFSRDHATPANVADFSLRNPAQVDFGWGSGFYQTDFGTHVVRPRRVNIKELVLTPLLKTPEGYALMGITNENNAQLPTPVSGAAQKEWDFIMNQKVIGTVFEWDSHDGPLLSIQFVLANGELREVNGPFNMYGTGTANIGEQRSLLQQLVDSKPAYSRINNIVFTGPHPASGSVGFVSSGTGISSGNGTIGFVSSQSD